MVIAGKYNSWEIEEEVIGVGFNTFILGNKVCWDLEVMII